MGFAYGFLLLNAPSLKHSTALVSAVHLPLPAPGYFKASSGVSAAGPSSALGGFGSVLLAVPGLNSSVGSGGGFRGHFL